MSAVLKDIQPQAQSQAIAGGVRLEARGLHKRYGAREVLRNTRLTIEPGQFIAIVGRSGSAWRWPVRWCTTRACCCSTSRWARWMR
jgi:ABC-type ATPase with predicted acetyltransferase domain